jgi:integrase
MVDRPLTAAAVAKYRPGLKRRRIRDAGARSLFLIIEPSGHRSWQMRFRTPTGRIGKLTLGPVYDGAETAGPPVVGMPLTLAGARGLAAEIHRQRALGHDPIADHKSAKRRQRAEIEERSANTFAVAVGDFIAEYARPKNRGWRWTAQLLGLRYDEGGGKPELIKGGLCERWRDRPVPSVDAHDIFTAVDEARRIGVPGTPARNSGLSEPRAMGLHAALSALFSWLARHRRVPINPCHGLSRPASSAPRERTLDSNEVRWFWKACDTVDAPHGANAPRPFGAAFRLLLATGQRRNEVALMTREELSEDRAMWSLPGARTKNGRPHQVPLSSLARDLIASMPGDTGLVFSTTKGRSAISGWSKAKSRLDQEMLRAAREERGARFVIPPWRLHDLRRTAVTGMVELGVPPHVVELVVNHVSGHRAGVAGTYNKAELIEERRTALERWAKHLAGVVAPKSDKVISLPRKRGSHGR